LFVSYDVDIFWIFVEKTYDVHHDFTNANVDTTLILQK
jgi:hypothetical protein